MDMQAGVAIVTGSSSGVGAACARKLAELGSHVVINYAHNEAGAQATADACMSYGVETLVVRADVADDAACRAMVAAAIAKWGRVDALINNAGTTKFCAHDNLEGLSAADFQRIYAVNTIGPFQMTRAVAPFMQRGGRGAIVNVASVAAVQGVGSSIAYAASKGALKTQTMSLARVMGTEVSVNAVLPGFIETGWLKAGMGAAYETNRNRYQATAALGEVLTPEDVAEAILYLLAANKVTGQLLRVDGGRAVGPALRRT